MDAKGEDTASRGLSPEGEFAEGVALTKSRDSTVLEGTDHDVAIPIWLSSEPGDSPIRQIPEYSAKAWAWFSIFLLNALASRVNRLNDIPMVRLCRSTSDLETCSGLGLPMTLTTPVNSPQPEADCSEHPWPIPGRRQLSGGPGSPRHAPRPA